MIKRIGEREIFRTKFFTVKDIDLKSSKGKVTYQIIEKRNTALVVPVTENHEVILVREYFPAINEYSLSLPKGAIEESDDALKTANKELQEEIGMKASKIEELGLLTMSPGYLTQKTHVFLAQDLIRSRLKGDELEEIEVLTYPFGKIDTLILTGKITEARVVAALYLARKKLMF